MSKINWTFVEDADDESAIMTFDPPLTVTGVPGQFSELKLREPNLAELRILDAGLGLESISKLLQRMTGWPAKAVDLLPQRAFEKVASFIVGFRTGGADEK